MHDNPSIHTAMRGRTKRWLTGPQVRARYGDRSDVWLWRKLKSDPLFPKPMWMATKRYWDEESLDEYDRQQMQTGKAAPKVQIPKEAADVEAA
jgi:hypothetical protein